MFVTRFWPLGRRTAPRSTLQAVQAQRHVTPFCRLISTTSEIMDDAKNRIYIHGCGNKAIFLAFYLSRLPDPPPVTIVVHEIRLFKKFTTTGKKVYLAIDGVRYESGEINMEIITIQSDGTRLTYTTRKSGPEDPVIIPSYPAEGPPLKPMFDSTKPWGAHKLPTTQQMPWSDKLLRLPGVRKTNPNRIMNLISTTRPRTTPVPLSELRDRLSWNSICIATQQNFGVWEVFKYAFQDG